MTSARGQLDGLGVRTPIGPTLPAMYHDDDFAQRLVRRRSTRCSPRSCRRSTTSRPTSTRQLAPDDFVDWLAGWVGIELDETWPEERRRELVARAVELYGRRGTAEGLADLIELYVGVRPTVEDSGGVAWSAAPGADLPGSGRPTVTVRLAADEGSVDARPAGEYGGDEQAGARRPPGRDPSRPAAAHGRSAAATTDGRSGTAGVNE